jgi:hypothetical protein
MLRREQKFEKSQRGTAYMPLLPYGWSLKKRIYIITTVKLAIWLVNNRAGSGYPARGIKMPSRDFRRILKMSLFHCSYFIKQLPNGFPSRIAWSMHLGCCSTFGKRKNTLACGSSIFKLSKSLKTSLVHGSRNPARKTIRYSFSIQEEAYFHVNGFSIRWHSEPTLCLIGKGNGLPVVGKHG